MQSKPRAFSYARVSTQEQSNHGVSLPVQNQTTAALIERLGADLVGNYVDAGVSAFKKRPPEFQRMLRDIESAKRRGEPVTYVVASAIDRLGRNVRTGIEAAYSLMDDLGVSIVTPQIDTSQPMGRQMLNFGLVVAEMESESNRRRVRETRPAALRRKRHPFGGRRKYGRDSSGQVLEREAKVLRRMAVMFLDGIPVRQIAESLNDEGIPAAEGGRWRMTGVTKMLRRPDLAGLMVIDGELVESVWARIIDRAIWDRVQARFAARATGSRKRGRPAALPYLLDAPIRVTCGVCGSRMRPATRSRSGRAPLARYVCVEHEIHSSCPMPFLDRDPYDGLIIDLFQTEILDPCETLRTMERAAKQAERDVRAALTEAEREVMRADGRLARVRGDYKDGALSVAEWRELRNEIETERQAAEAEAAQLRERLASFEREDDVREAQRVLHALLGRLRDLAVRYEPGDGTLVAAIRAAMTEVVEEVVLHTTSVPANLVTREPLGGGVQVAATAFPGISVEIVPRVMTAEPTYFERVALPAGDKEHFTSMIWSVPSAFFA